MRKGFTLIELLIVIGILAILGTTTFLVIKPVEIIQKTRDARRVQDLAAMQKALSFFALKYGKYPCGDSLTAWGTPAAGVADSSDSVPFLDGVKTPGSNPSTCPNSSVPGGSGYPEWGIVKEGFTQKLGPGGGYNDPLFDPDLPLSKIGVYAYWYHVDLTRSKYVLTAKLELDEKNFMGTDGGSCPNRYEVGNGLPLLAPGYPATEDTAPACSTLISTQGQCADTC